MIALAAVDAAVRRAAGIAEHLFAEVGRRTTAGGGIRRAPFGTGEQTAADLVSAAAADLDLAVTVDLVGNVHMTWVGEGGDGKVCFTGSHLDSVPNGGNFDGLAGILAGLVAVAALRETGAKPRRDITVIGIRGEESAWFGCQHVGSRVALGLFDPALLDRALRFDTGRSLADHLVQAGIDPDPIRARTPSIQRARAKCFLELHIEQGPLLHSRDLSVGLVTGIRGNIRCPEVRLKGAPGHAGTVPRELRRDALVTAAEIIVEMNREWERSGEDLVMTFGRAGTNPATHSVTSIPGEAMFSFEARSHSSKTLDMVATRLRACAEAIGYRHGVDVSFDPFTGSAPVAMDQELRRRMKATAEESGIPTIEMASGAGHDAADFAEAGIPSAMIFVRNDKGSHNPDEFMDLSDFLDGTRILASTLLQESIS